MEQWNSKGTSMEHAQSLAGVNARYNCSGVPQTSL